MLCILLGILTKLVKMPKTTAKSGCDRSLIHGRETELLSLSTGWERILEVEESERNKKKNTTLHNIFAVEKANKAGTGIKGYG